ncbi:hypothetical protein CC86DRAFT_5602 [Ophiobolus disseminans]|uniref:Uncharacterized protein n=1 Tax=Ophiobolus disseminans TaxID=1469910 RepID=A0A6A7AKE2_9PLEO|nr:hypothetical protein CC86DRAFT_5602 [Ophiobolus disseminans]
MPLVHFAFDGYVTSPTTASQDPYGIAKISGFYGPGTWSGWILAAVASAIRIFTNPHAKLDPNTWLFVVGTNWAAVDIFRTLPRVYLTDEASPKAIGHLSAALMFTCWGNIYGLIQLSVLLCRSEENSPPTQRMITQAIGLVLPSFAQTAVAFSVSTNADGGSTLGGVDLLTIPFLYFGSEFDIRGREIVLWGFFCSAFVLSNIIFIASPSLLGVWLYRSHERVRPRMRAIKSLLYGRDWLYVVTLVAFCFCSILGYFSFVIELSSEKFSLPFWVRFMLSFLPLFCLGFAASILYGLCFVCMVAWYFVTLFSTGFKSWGAACFFMPFAPQSITEWDQAFGLVVGVILLFGVEICPAILRYKKERQEFVEDLENRMEEARENRSNLNPDLISNATMAERLSGTHIELEDLTNKDEPDGPLPSITGPSVRGSTITEGHVDEALLSTPSCAKPPRSHTKRHGTPHRRTNDCRLAQRRKEKSNHIIPDLPISIQPPHGRSDVETDDESLAVTALRPSSHQGDHIEDDYMMSGALPFGYFYMSACH